jgi:hypothetical protein
MKAWLSCNAEGITPKPVDLGFIANGAGRLHAGDFTRESGWMKEISLSHAFRSVGGAAGCNLTC